MIVTRKSLSNVEFPVYKTELGLLDRVDGLILIDDRILDDTNMPGETLGQRRLQTHTKLEDLSPLIRQIPSPIGLIQHPTNTRYIDSLGRVFWYKKTIMSKVISCKILSVTPKDGIGTAVKLRGIKNIFALKRPPPLGYRWAGVIYIGKFPWIIYEFSEEQQRTRRLKI